MNNFPLVNSCAILKQVTFRLGGLAVGSIIFTSIAQSMTVETTSYTGTEGGVSAGWIFANLSFTGMRAQATGTTFWKVVTFIFGFPGTLLTLFVVPQGSERAYGIDMPRKTAAPANPQVSPSKFYPGPGPAQ
jgi:hypothetical protein